MRTIIALLLLTVALAQAGDIIPCAKWPNPVVTPDGKQWSNPTVAQCVSAGYRLLAPKPATPEGYRIVSEKIIQDAVSPEKCKYAISCELIPAPPPPPVYVPEVLTNLPPEKVLFQFTTNGIFRGVIRVADVTNKVTTLK